jgi:hypothetical protein
MGRDDVALVSRFLAAIPSSGDVGKTLDDSAVIAMLREMVHPDAETRFVDPKGGALGDFRPSQRGPEGLQAGWREWLKPWDDFRVEFEENVDAGAGTVLSLVELRGRARGGPEIHQPGAAITRIRDGLIVSVDFYMDQDQAREDARLSSSA